MTVESTREEQVGSAFSTRQPIGMVATRSGGARRPVLRDVTFNRSSTAGGQVHFLESSSLDFSGRCWNKCDNRCHSGYAGRVLPPHRCIICFSVLPFGILKHIQPLVLLAETTAEAALGLSNLVSSVNLSRLARRSGIKMLSRIRSLLLLRAPSGMPSLSCDSAVEFASTT